RCSARGLAATVDDSGRTGTHQRRRDGYRTFEQSTFGVVRMRSADELTVYARGRATGGEPHAIADHLPSTFREGYRRFMSAMIAAISSAWSAIRARRASS